jgi:predicted Zn-dependent protease
MVAVQVGSEAIRINRPHEAARVLEVIDPTRGELRGYRGYWMALTEAYHLVGRYEDELRAARRSRATDPADPAALVMEARALTALGRTAEALPLIDVRLAMPWGIGPSPDVMMLVLARELQAHGHAAAAATVWQRLLVWLDARAAEPPQSPECRACRGYALAGLGRATEARSIFSALAEEDTTNVLAQRNLGVAAARTGDRTTAARAAARLTRATGREVPLALYWRAQIAAQLGDLAGATELLREALGRGLPFTSTFFHESPELEPLRGFPPFRALVSPKG